MSLLGSIWCCSKCYNCRIASPSNYFPHKYSRFNQFSYNEVYTNQHEGLSIHFLIRKLYCILCNYFKSASKRTKKVTCVQKWCILYVFGSRIGSSWSSTSSVWTRHHPRVLHLELPYPLGPAITMSYCNLSKMIFHFVFSHYTKPKFIQTTFSLNINLSNCKLKT